MLPALTRIVLLGVVFALLCDTYHSFTVLRFAARERCQSIVKSSLQSGAHVRREHKNKYSQFSSKNKDPLQVTIDKTRMVAEKAHQDNLVTGTTVPTATGSNFVRQDAPLTTQSVDSKKIIPSDPSTFGFEKIGFIVGAHGVHGEVKIELSTDFADYRIRNGSILFIKRPSRRTPRPIRIRSGRKMVDSVYIVQFESITSRLSSTLLQSYEVFVKSHDRPSLGNGDFLLRDLVGLKCYLVGKQNESHIGIVSGVIPPDELCEPSVRQFMHSLLELKLKESKNTYCLVPFVNAIVPEVNIDGQYLLLDPPVGLLEETYTTVPKVVLRGYLPSHIDRLSARDRENLAQHSVRLFVEGGIIIEE